MRTGTLATALACCALALPAGAQAPGGYPNKSIRVILPSSAGGPVDVVARTIGPGYSEALGQQLVMDNRAGAGGVIGAEIVANAAPDGYTLMISHSGPLAIEPLMQAKPRYDPIRDFAPISLVAATPYLLLVHPNVPAKSVTELVKLAKAQPGKLNFASGGPGTGIHMAAELLNVAAGIQVAHVPYKGASPGMTALISGEVAMMFNGLPSALPQVKAGRLRALAVAGAKRTSLLPDLPTIAESGIVYDTSGWYGLVAPRGTPPAIVAVLQRNLAKALAMPDMQKRLADLGIDPIGSTPEELARFLKEEQAKWSKVVKAVGIKPH